jgi:hypothetical protein
MNFAIDQHYKAVLDDLQARRASLMEEIRRIDLLIDGIRGQLDPVAGITVSLPSRSSIANCEQTTKQPRIYDYGRMSVRWGVLAYLAEGSASSAKTAQIATQLRDGGYQSGGANFANIVSGVLSTLKARGEVEGSSEEGYRLTIAGQAAWQHIKSSPKFTSQQTSLVVDNA